MENWEDLRGNRGPGCWVGCLARGKGDGVLAQGKQVRGGGGGGSKCRKAEVGKLRTC